MATESQTSATTESTDSILWCNFCNFKTTDQEEYLKHSCKDILEAQGKDMAPTDQKECR